MSHEVDRIEHPTLSADGPVLTEAEAAVARLVNELQNGVDEHDAVAYNRHFAADVMWGSPHGATVYGYDDLHAIHTRLQREASRGDAPTGSLSRYEVVHVASPAPRIAIAHVRRVTLDVDGTALPASEASPSPFSEMALYVLVERGGTWWLAAGQNTIIDQQAGR